MSIRALSYFLVAAEELNFSKAARRLYIAQQTLSNHIKRLEENYGVKLFERHPRLRLTPSGECMVHYATRILRLERNMSAEFADLSKKASGLLLVGCSRVRGKYFFPQIWSDYRHMYPNIEIRMIEGNSSFLETELLSRKLDICIGMNISDQLNIAHEALISERLFFVIGRRLFGHYFGKQAEKKAAEFREGVRFSDLLDLPLLLQPQNNYIRKIINKSFEAHDIVARSIFESNDSEMLCNMCIAGNGGAFLSESGFFLPIELIRQKLEYLYAFPLIDITLSSVIAYPKDLTLPYYSRAFITICQQVFLDTLSKARHQLTLLADD